MLRKIRISLAAVMFVLITLLFLDFTGTLHAWFGFLAKIQFLPALLALNVVVVVSLVLLTLLFGRIYCSVICPLGVMQDVISHMHAVKRKNRFSYSKEKKVLRYGFLVIFAVAFIAGAHVIVSLLAPYSSYGRMVSHILQPVYIMGNNLLAAVAEHADSYMFYSADVWVKSVTTLGVAALTFALIFVLAWRGGRTYCNTVCPVGTILGFFSRFSLYRVTCDESKCNSCGLCEKNCKASAIDSKNHKIDYSRCVVCGDCIGKCKKQGLHYEMAFNRKKASASSPADAPKAGAADTSRRSFIIGAALATSAAALAQEKKKVDGGLAAIADKKAPARDTRLTPPGSLSAQNMASHCTACQLCVSACPNGVLRPSTDLNTFMQPEMGYERGYCRPECTKCSEVCPAGAIKPIRVEDKVSTQIGHAVWIKANCVPLTDGVECGNCARHCPVGAIMMVPSDPNDEKSVKIPAVDETRCIGCGACENLCPSRPFSAIYVEGHDVHRIR